MSRDQAQAQLALEAAEALEKHDLASSLSAYDHAVRVAAQVGDRLLEAEAELGWGGALVAIEGRELESGPHLQRATELGAGTSIEARAWFLAADGLRRVSRIADAAMSLRRSARLFVERGDASGELVARGALATLLLDDDQAEQALPELARATALAVEEQPELAPQLLLQYGEVLLRRLDRPAEAVPALRIAAEMFQRLGDRQREGRARVGLIAAQAMASPRGRREVPYDQLIQMSELAAERAADEGDANAEAVAHWGLARLLAEQAALREREEGGDG